MPNTMRCSHVNVVHSAVPVVEQMRKNWLLFESAAWVVALQAKKSDAIKRDSGRSAVVRIAIAGSLP